MKSLVTFTGILSAIIAAVVLRPVNSYQGFMVKATATAQTPALVILGLVTAALGLRKRSPLAAASGAFGAAVGGIYIRKVTAPHAGLERAFGPGAVRDLPPDALRHQRRFVLRLPHVPEPRWTRDLPFATVPGTNRQLLADLWEPAEEIAHSGIAIVYLYGGSWHFFDKDVFTRPLFRQLAARGHVVMDAGHRSCPETDVFGMVGDVHRAVAWTKANAPGLGINPERVVVMGGSSGAHIALLAAFAPDDPAMKPDELQDADTSVMAVVSWYGIPDLSTSYTRWLGQQGPGKERPMDPAARSAPSPAANRINRWMMGRTLTAAQSPPGPPVRQSMRNLIGGTPDEAPDRAELASPLHHVSPQCPPTLLFQGTHDAVVPLDAARRLARALEDADVPVVYVEFPWTEHAFDLVFPPLANPAAKAALHDLERFLALVVRQAGRAVESQSGASVA
jgi:acetyl esterase/lipase